MPTDATAPKPPAHDAGEARPPKRSLPPEAERALSEAAARRAARPDRLADATLAAAKEINGRGGLDPTRYGDWEKDGLASDF